MTNIKDYITDRSGNMSMLNLNVKDYLTDIDWYNILITDENKYRIDLISEKYLFNNQYYIYILMINDIVTYEDLGPGKYIKIPTLDFINRVIKQLKEERGI
jgi:hypothetical protein